MDDSSAHVELFSSRRPWADWGKSIPNGTVGGPAKGDNVGKIGRTRPCSTRGRLLTSIYPEPDPNPYAVVPEVVTTDLSAMAGVRTCALLAHWRALGGGPGVPKAADFHPVDVYALASRLLLLDVVREAGGRLRHRYRFVGTRIVRYRLLRGLGDHTGSFVDEAPRYYSGDLLEESYRRCTEEAVPVLTTGAWCGVAARGRFERLALPLSGEDGTVNRLATLVDRFEDE